MKDFVKLIKKNRVVIGIVIAFVLLLLIMCIFWLSKKGTFGYDLDSGSLVINCPNTVSAGQTVSCDVSLNMVDPITVYSVNANYNLGEGLTFDSFVFDDTECSGEGCFELFQTTDEGFAVINTDGVIDGGYVGTINFVVTDDAEPNEEFEVGLNNIELCYDDNGEEEMLSLQDASLTIHTGNSDATLTSLSIYDIEFLEEFSSDELNYTASVSKYDNITYFSFDYTTASQGAHVVINGIENASEHVFELGYGHNIYNIVVTAEDNQTTLTYTVDIYREFGFVSTTYQYIDTLNVLYTGSDTDEEIIAKLGDPGEGLIFGFDFDHNKINILSDDDYDEIVYTIDILRFGTDYAIYDDQFYLNDSLTYSDLLDIVDDEYFLLELYDSSGEQVIDLDTEVADGYYMILHYNDILLAEYHFVGSQLSFDSSLVVDDDNLVIARIPAGKTVTQFLEMIETSGTVGIYTSDGTPVTNDSLIYTGLTLTIETSSGSVTYTLSVLGDVNGDGDIYLNDISMAYRYYMGNVLDEELVVLNTAQRYACDIINDGEIYLNDVSRLYRYRMGYESSLEVVSNE